MVKHLLTLLIILLIIKPISAQSNRYDSILVGSDWRTFLIHLPKGYNANHPYSVILGLHGGGGSALQFALSSELNSKADSVGFIVVFPEGKKNPGVIGARTWNAGYCCATNSSAGTNDVGFISQLVDTLLSRYSVDTNRVYATGHSNGGMMCYRLATELSDKIAAIAISSATMVRNYPFLPTRPIPVIHFHSYKDQNVPYYGGLITGVNPPVHSPPVDSILSIWSDFDQCTIHDTIHKGGTYNQIVFGKGKCESEVNEYITFDGGHAWPGGKPGGGPDSDTPSTAISANYLLWKFFQQHDLHCPTTAIPKIRKNDALLLFPNPLNMLSSYLQIQLPDNSYDVCLYDAAMRKVRYAMNCRNEVLIDCTDLMPGFYMVEASSPQGVLRGKFIKQ
jgi:polyhydroxybutyrate depolymerase